MERQYIDDRLYFRALGWGKVARVDLLNRGGESCGSSKSCYGKDVCAMHGYRGLFAIVEMKYKRLWADRGAFYTLPVPHGGRQW